MAYLNGRLPASDLAPIGGGYYLRKDAAEAFNAMSDEALRVYGVRVTVVAGYRTLQRQVELWNLYLSGRGNLAARPGTSNHGWGLAVDLSSPYVRHIVDQIGAKYGFSKSWSDAPSEWWHVLYQPGHFQPPPADPLMADERAWVDELLALRKVWRRWSPKNRARAHRLRDVITARIHGIERAGELGKYRRQARLAYLKHVLNK